MHQDNEKEYQRDFKGIWIPKEVWLDERLNALDKIILAEIDSLDNEDGCYASNEQLASFCQCSIRNVTKSVSMLINYGYIYLENFDGRKRILRSRLAKNAMQTSKICYADSQNIPPININNNNNNKKENITNVIKEKESKCRFGNYNRILLTNTEYERLCSDFGKDVTDKQIELLDEYIESNNNKNKYTNFNLVIRKSLRENWFVKPDTTYTNNKRRIIRANNPQWLKDYVENFEDGVEDL